MLMKDGKGPTGMFAAGAIAVGRMVGGRTDGRVFGRIAGREAAANARN